MSKLSKYTFIITLLIAFLLITTVGCGQESTSSDKPKNIGVKPQLEQQQNPAEQTMPTPERTPAQQAAGETEAGNGQPRNSSGEQTDTVVQELITAIVTRVVDGDTVEVELANGSKEKVRLIGVDTPELTKEVEPYGKESLAYTKSRLDGCKVWLKLDVGERDRYDRLLAYIWLELPANNSEAEVRAKMFNAELLLNGYAQVMTVSPNVKYADLFVKLKQEAREAGKGLWDLNGKVEDAYYVASTKSNKFHRPDCEWGQKIAPANLIKFKTADEALDAGYEPCRVCKP